MAEQLKELYNSVFLKNLGEIFKNHYSGFDTAALESLVDDNKWSSWALMDRLHAITDRLEALLPGSFGKKLGIMEKAAPKVSGFQAMFFPDFAERFGIEYPDLSLPYLKSVTRYSSSEFAIRKFILRDSAYVMRLMKDWSYDTNDHVRRLSSEGCRPRLPWSINLPDFIENPEPIFDILENLKMDNSKYVQKSVANNLNDISKDHPDKIVSIAKAWIGKDKNTDWILKHACRTLLKSGHPQIMPVFDFDVPTMIIVENFKLNKSKLTIGDITRFNAEIVNTDKNPVRLRLEYIVGFPRNSHQYNKVFFLKETVIDSNSRLNISGKIDLEEKSTRKIYPGKISIHLQINGKIKFSIDDEIKA